jgi:fatty acid desaturase
MSQDNSTQKINWYRTPIDRALLNALNHRSDARGLLQALGHLGVIAFTSAAAFYTLANLHWLWLLPVLFLHGTVYAFLLNGFHELCHGTVFKSKWLNTLFLNVFSFMGSLNPVSFWASHTEHHKYTLHPPDDLEVVLPVTLTVRDFLKYSFVNPWGFVEHTRKQIRVGRGRLEGEWENALPASDPAKRQRLFNWSRLLLFGHGGIAIVSIALSALIPGLWLIPVLLTLAPFYGGLLLFLCNNTQHVGLQDNAPDFRLCTRTILLNPVVRFLYWHMNFHIEHHMFAAVPCYNLEKLHNAIKHDLPPSPAGIVATWRHISAILERQKTEPAYAFVPELPRSRVGRTA